MPYNTKSNVALLEDNSHLMKSETLQSTPSVQLFMLRPDIYTTQQ
jgi:hypothetical protein